MVVGAHDRDAADLERLAQRFQALRWNSRLVEEQHALVRERDLARARVRAAADHGRDGVAWCGLRNGRRSVRRPSCRRPATLATMLTSRISAGSSGGSSPGRRAASIDLPAPGGPISRRLWLPAAAISSARLAVSWPLMSVSSG